MPIMNGPAMLEAIRDEPPDRNIPAVVMSSLPEGAVAATAKGMYSAFLRKPFKIRAVVDIVNAV
jgi:CheY-like chemotaxis protein